MVPRRCILAFVYLLINLSSVLIFYASELATAAATSATYISQVCENSKNFTNESSYGSNLKVLLSSLSYATRINDFYYATAGRRLPDVVFGLYLCRGDVTNLICQDCVANAASEIQMLCPTQKEAIIWYDKCMLRYSDEPIFNISGLTPTSFKPGSRHGSDDQFGLLLDSFINTLAAQAANSREQSKKFAAGKQNLTSSGSETMYGLVQCTPDLSVADCSKCFRSAIAAIPTCCNGQRSARLLLPSCYVLYDLKPFFNVTAMETPPPPPPSSSPSGTVVNYFKIFILFFFFSFFFSGLQIIYIYIVVYTNYIYMYILLAKIDNGNIINSMNQ